MKKILVFILGIFILASCQKDRDPAEVDYLITGFGSPYTVSYLDADGSTITRTITPNGISDKWEYTFLAEPGTPLYLYIKSKEDISANMSFNVGLLIDGKYYQQAKNYDGTLIVKGDTIYEIKRSGVVPF
jgi:hypothetical protein